MRELVEFRRQWEDWHIADFNFAARLENRSVDVDQLMADHPVERKLEIQVGPLNPGLLLDEPSSSLAIRHQGLYLLHAAAGEKIDFRVAPARLGSFQNGLSYVLQAPSGQIVRESEVEVDSSEQFSLVAEETGIYKLACAAGRNAIRVSSTGRLAVKKISGQEHLHLVTPTGTLYFLVPAGVEEFEVDLAGRGNWAHAKGALLNPDGLVAEEKDHITGVNPHTFRGRREEAGEGEVWSLRLERPGDGMYQDVYVSFSEQIPPLFSFHPDTLLVPEP